MKGILINPFKMTVTDVEIGRKLEDVYNILTTPEIGVVSMIERVQIKNDQDLWLDEEGLFKAHQSKFGFTPLGFNIFSGCAILLGSTEDLTEWDDTKLSIREVYDCMMWEKKR